jgi:tyrosyl-tRNA synthetase
LIQQGGAYVNGAAVQDTEMLVNQAQVEDGAILLRFGKKKYHRVVVG